MLQGRIFSYADTQLYRVGTNGMQLPVNRPRAAVANHNQDGNMNPGSKQVNVNYEPSERVSIAADAGVKYSRLPLTGTTQQQRIDRTQNFKQAGDFYRSLQAQEQANLVSNLAADLGKVKDDGVKYTMLSFFYKADANYGHAVAQAVKADAARVQAQAAKLAD